MSNKLKERDLAVVELADGILVKTPIPSSNHAALRSGFARYPANPRWNATKIHAWKTGRRWREALTHGDMVVRTDDSMLVNAN